MLKFLMIFVAGVFLAYIFLWSYRFIRYGKSERIFIKFMTSCMILFTFTFVCYGDILFNENGNKVRNRNLYQLESKVFISNYESSLENDNENDIVNKKETAIKITAYFDNANPPRGSVTNLIVTGPPEGKVTAICQYKGHGSPYIMNIGANGQAVIPIKVENDAEPGLLVVVDISVIYADRKYNTNAVFTPQ